MTLEEYNAMDRIQQTLAETYYAIKDKQGEVSEEFLAYVRDMNEVWVKHIKAIC